MKRRYSIERGGLPPDLVNCTVTQDGWRLSSASWPAPPYQGYVKALKPAHRYYLMIGDEIIGDPSKGSFASLKDCARIASERMCQ